VASLENMNFNITNAKSEFFMKSQMQPQKGLEPFMPMALVVCTTLTVNPFCVVFHLNPTDRA
jgi:hypothetical protein